MVALLQVDVDDARFGRLLQLYLHEWSAYVATPMSDEALFSYDELPRYRDRDARAVFLVVDAGTPRGFALAMRDETARWHVEELFVVAGARCLGIGARAARALFAAHPGPWTLTVRAENPGGLAFWRRVVPGGDDRVEVGADGVTRTRFSFTTDA